MTAAWRGQRGEDTGGGYPDGATVLSPVVWMSTANKSSDGASDARSTGFSGAVSISSAGSAATTQLAAGDTEVPLENEQKGRCSCHCCGKVVLGIIVAWLAITLIGREIEQAVWMNAPDTRSLYTTAQVCGRKDGVDYTFPNISVLAAESANVLVHCGECGACSNDVDVGVMYATQDSLTGTAVRCSLRIYYGGRGAVYDCFQENVGFSDRCNECWTQNVVDNFRHCKFTCAISLLLREQNNDETGELSSVVRRTDVWAGIPSVRGREPKAARDHE
eukprot:COSAG02_NODE_3871_length_6115_cov_13.733544_2_plen_276_part_00